MSEKSVSKYLQHLDKHFAGKNPVLQQAAKIYHELDQIVFDLDMISDDETMASKTSWWPLITMIGTPTSGKPELLNHYLKKDLQATGAHTVNTGYSVLYHGDNDNVITLPGTALDRDPRLPFYQISDKIEQVKEGAGNNINAYINLKTCNSVNLDGKIIISAPGLETDSLNEVNEYLTHYAVEMSDLVLVFFDAAKPDLEPFAESLSRFFSSNINSQRSDKFIYIINQRNSAAEAVDLTAWKNRLAQYGLESGHFFAIQEQQTSPTSEFGLFNQTKSTGQQAIEQKIENVDIDSSYRILSSLEQNIQEVETVAISEINKALNLWKERVHFTSTLILSCIVLALVLAEVQIGFLAVLIDPIIGPIALVALILFMIPIHLYSSRQHAKLIVHKLDQRQQELGLVENLGNLFEKSLTTSRMLLPIKTPVGWTKTSKASLNSLLSRAKDLVQSLNDSFSTVGISTTTSDASVSTDDLPG